MAWSLFNIDEDGDDNDVDEDDDDNEDRIDWLRNWWLEGWWEQEFIEEFRNLTEWWWTLSAIIVIGGKLWKLDERFELAGTDIVCENGSMDNEPDDKLILPKLSSPKLVLPFNNVQAFDDELDKFVRIVVIWFLIK